MDEDWGEYDCRMCNDKGCGSCDSGWVDWDDFDDEDEWE